MFDVLNKHKLNEKFLYVCSENQQDNEIVNWLKEHASKFELGYMYRSVSSDISALLKTTEFDIICLFTPSGLKVYMTTNLILNKTVPLLVHLVPILAKPLKKQD